MSGLIHRPAVVAGAAVVLLGPAVASIAAGTAAQAAPGNCTTAGTTVTCTYAYTGGNQSFTVPAGVNSLDVTAVGAAGGAGFMGYAPTGSCFTGESIAGGAGASVEDTAVPVSQLAGQALTVIVGGTGGDGGAINGVRAAALAAAGRVATTRAATQTLFVTLAAAASRACLTNPLIRS